VNAGGGLAFAPGLLILFLGLLLLARSSRRLLGIHPGRPLSSLSAVAVGGSAALFGLSSASFIVADLV
jgi:hypothetical protein